MRRGMPPCAGGSIRAVSRANASQPLSARGCLRTFAVPGTAAARRGALNAVIVLGNGDSVNLGALFAAGSDRKVQIDGKLFAFESVRSSSFTVSDFAVVGSISASTNQWELRNVGFDLTGPFGDGSPGDGHVHEANLQCSVAVMQDAYERGVRLRGVKSVFNGSSGGEGSFARVDESVFDIFGRPRDTRLQDYADYCELEVGAAALLAERRHVLVGGPCRRRQVRRRAGRGIPQGDVRHPGNGSA